MLDIGGWEFLVVAFVLVMVVGPKELPKMLRSFTAIMQQIRRTASEFTRSMTDIANESDMADLKNTLEKAKSGDLTEIANAIDPGGEVGEAVEGLTNSVRDGAAGSDLDEIGKIGKAAGDDIAAASMTPKNETTASKPKPKPKPKTSSGKKKPARSKS